MTVAIEYKDTKRDSQNGFLEGGMMAASDIALNVLLFNYLINQ